MSCTTRLDRLGVPNSWDHKPEEPTDEDDSKRNENEYHRTEYYTYR